MKNRLLVLLIALLIINCEKEKKKTIDVEEKVEELIVEDSLNTLEVDSTVPTVTIPKTIVRDKIPVKKIESKTEKIEIPPRPKNNEISIIPINHATMILETETMVIYIDPVGGKERFKNYRPPNFILITDIHGDHFNLETIKGIIGDNTILIGPRAIKDKLTPNLLTKFTTIFNGLGRGFSTSQFSLDVAGVAMYNLREDAKKYHPKGRGNGYVLTMNNKRIYISGDTEDVLEMRQLKNIDIAFVCMNLPYTMTEEQAADAVLAFKPKKVYPYHYRGSDVKKFKRLVNKSDPAIKVVQLNWYPPSS